MSQAAVRHAVVVKLYHPYTQLPRNIRLSHRRIARDFFDAWWVFSTITIHSLNTYWPVSCWWQFYGITSKPRGGKIVIPKSRTLCYSKSNELQSALSNIIEHYVVLRYVMLIITIIRLGLQSDCARVEALVADATQKARYLASMAPHSGDWLLALPITSCGLRLDDEAVRVRASSNVLTTWQNVT